MRWAPVVYGRTAAADTWWQAIPEGAGGSGWLVEVVGAVFAGGTGLDSSPRFLLAQDYGHRIVGIACRARNLSDQMCSDDQRRELSCFVGWMTPRPAAGGPAAAGPALPDLQLRYAQWARPVYEEVMSAAWKLPYSPFRRPAVSYPTAAPWGENVRFDLAGSVPRPGDGLWPPSAWPDLWAAALIIDTPFTCVLGWQQAMSAWRKHVTFLGAADASPREASPVPTLMLPAHQDELADTEVSVLDDAAAASLADDSSAPGSPSSTDKTTAGARPPARQRLPSRLKSLLPSTLKSRLASRRGKFLGIIALAVIAIVVVVMVARALCRP